MSPQWTEHVTTALDLVVAGASGDHSNLGVTALLHSALAGIRRGLPNARFTVFDNGEGVRRDHVSADGTNLPYDRCGVRLSRRYHRPESLWNIQMSTRLGGLGNPAARALLAADAVVDASGGDSFTDLYGSKRFRTVVEVKRAALDAGAPLILLPQTIGPFASVEARRTARAMTSRARLVIARDDESYGELAELLGNEFDPGGRHRVGVDLAFGLERHDPPASVRLAMESWLGEADGPVAGLNVSGLVFNEDGWHERLGVPADNYREAVGAVVRGLLVHPNVRVLLICHVVSSPDNPESDSRASNAVVSSLPADLQRRVMVAPLLKDPSTTKWLISRCDWFCGTRMHATIAALSSGVPTAAIAYSDKTRGVFGSCGQAHRVADARAAGADEIVSAVLESWEQRERTRNELRAQLPHVFARAENQLQEIVAAASEGRPRGPRRSGAARR